MNLDEVTSAKEAFYTYLIKILLQMQSFAVDVLTRLRWQSHAGSIRRAVFLMFLLFHLD